MHEKQQLLEELRNLKEKSSWEITSLKQENITQKYDILRLQQENLAIKQ